jgi:hypothetical protein
VIVYQNRAVFDFKSIISFFDEFFEKYAIFDQFGFNLRKKLAKMYISKLKQKWDSFTIFDFKNVKTVKNSIFNLLFKLWVNDMIAITYHFFGNYIYMIVYHFLGHDIDMI